MRARNRSATFRNASSAIASKANGVVAASSTRQEPPGLAHKRLDLAQTRDARGQRVLPESTLVRFERPGHGGWRVPREMLA